MLYNEDGSPRRSTIFYVEDDATMIDLFKIALDELNLESEVNLVTAKDAEEALIMLETNQPSAPHWPDLILLDLHLPGKSGIGLMGDIKSSRLIPDVPVVLFTSSQDPKEKRSALELGARDFLHKPTDFSLFVESVKTACSYVQGFESPNL